MRHPFGWIHVTENWDKQWGLGNRANEPEGTIQFKGNTGSPRIMHKITCGNHTVQEEYRVPQNNVIKILAGSA
jgi:hypothetical protein